MEKIRRSKEIKLRLTPAEHEQLRTLAGDAPLAEWVREFALQAAQSDIFEHIERKHAKQAAKREAELTRLSVDPKLLRALAGIGNNINQIARLTNAASVAGKPWDLVAVAIELQHATNAIEALRKSYTPEQREGNHE